MEQSNTPGQDALTQLMTRKAFNRALREQLPLLREGDQEISFAFWDIDEFMAINTEFGHEAGDRVLIEIAEITTALLGPEARVARFGGDEFAAYLPNIGREDSLLLLERLRGKIEGHRFHDTDGNELSIHATISIGISSCPTDGRTFYELMRKASEALYRAKVEGRNRIRLARLENMLTKTTHYTQSQLERLGKLAAELNLNEAELLREAMDDLLLKYEFNDFLDRNLIRKE